MKRPLSDKQQKKLTDDARLLRAWRKWHAEQKDAVLNGPYAAALNELMRMLNNLQHASGSQLVGLTRAVDWSGIDANTRAVVLHEANVTITKHRERMSEERPIDDGLPGDPPCAFRLMKETINQFPAPAGKGRSPVTVDLNRANVKHGD